MVSFNKNVQAYKEGLIVNPNKVKQLGNIDNLQKDKKRVSYSAFAIFLAIFSGLQIQLPIMLLSYILKPFLQQ